MRKLRVVCIIIFIVSLSACTRNNVDKKNFLGGYGNIYGGSYSNAYISAFYEDDIYIYYGKLKINKNTGQYLSLCENTGCSHDNSDCKEYSYGGRIFPDKNRIFYTKGKDLYIIDNKGKTEYIDSFNLDKAGIKLDEYISIEQVMPINEKCIYIVCGEGSCFYNINTKEKLYVLTYYMCGNDEYAFYYDRDSDAIIRLSINNWTTEKLDNTYKMFPCICVNDKLYCNTVYGTVCSIASGGACEVVLAGTDIYYKLIGIEDNKMLYCMADMDIVIGTTLECNIYSMDMENKTNIKLNEELIKLIDIDCFFVGNNNFYMLDLDNRMSIQGIYQIDMNDNSIKYYKGEYNTLQSNGFSDSEAHENDMESIKGFDMVSNFYVESEDTMTGQISLIPQNQQRVVVDGTKQKMTYKYMVDVRGDYPKEGIINIFVMCDGIIQKSSINGEEYKLINKIQYVDEEEMSVDIEYELQNASHNGKFMVCHYLSDTIITDDFDEYTNYNEFIMFNNFSYRTDDNYELDYVNPSPYYSNYNMEDVYSLEQDEEFDKITTFWAISNSIPAKEQRDRWRLMINNEENLKLIFHNEKGQYNLYLLVDDVPVKLSEDEMLLCDINGNFDSVVYELTTRDILSPDKPHTVKLICYDRTEGMVSICGYQIIQVKE